MNASRTIYRGVGICIVTVCALNCSLNIPQGGGVRHESRICHAQGNIEYTHDDFAVGIDDPDCPYTVKAVGQSLRFMFTMEALSADVQDGAIVGGDIYNEKNAIVGGTSGPYSFVFLKDTSVVEAQPSGFFNGGTGGDTIADSAALTVEGTVDGTNAIAGINMPGDISTANSNVIGASAVAVGTSQWRTQSYWDTTMYRFNWFVDGAPATSNDADATLIHAFPLAGNHTLKVVTILADQTTDTTTVNVIVGAYAAASGPTTITTTAPATYTATASGCNTTCTYAWTLTSKQPTQKWNTSTGTTTVTFNQEMGSPVMLKVQAVSDGIVGYGNTISIINNVGNCSGKFTC